MKYRRDNWGKTESSFEVKFQNSMDKIIRKIIVNYRWDNWGKTESCNRLLARHSTIRRWRPHSLNAVMRRIFGICINICICIWICISSLSQCNDEEDDEDYEEEAIFTLSMQWWWRWVFSLGPKWKYGSKRILFILGWVKYR